MFNISRINDSCHNKTYFLNFTILIIGDSRYVIHFGDLSQRCCVFTSRGPYYIDIIYKTVTMFGLYYNTSGGVQ